MTNISTGTYGLVQPLEYNPSKTDWLNWMDVLSQQLGSLQNYQNQQPVPLVVNGVYSSVFQSGYVLYTGPGQTIATNTNFIFGLQLPNPSGTPAPCLLLGSGVPQAWIITDEQVPGNPGINLGIAAGETAASGTDPGGQLLLFGGAAFGGKGGQALLQGGTSLNGIAGDTQVAGGNSTNGPAGNVFLIGGQTGISGGSVHVIMTDTGHGTPGSFVIRLNSTVLYTINNQGAIFSTNTGAGLAGQPFVSGGPNAPATWLSTGFTGTITTAKLTPGGANGSMTFASGILISQTQAT